MPIPLAVAAGLGLTSTALGLYDVIKGGANARKAEQATQSLAKELEDVKVKNMMADLKVPTRGADLAREAGAERYATSVAAAQSAGAEGVIGLLPKLEQQQARQDLAIGAQLEQAEAQRDRVRAQGAQQAENANVAAQRQMGMMRLQGAATAAAEGRRRQQAGLQSAIGGLGQAAALGLEYSPLYGKAKDTGAATAGLTGQGSFVPNPSFPSAMGDTGIASYKASLDTPSPFAANRGGIPNLGFQGSTQQQGGFIGPMQATPSYGSWDDVPSRLNPDPDGPVNVSKIVVGGETMVWDTDNWAWAPAPGYNMDLQQGPFGGQ
tara:strand:+ start:3193 stop:4155 length:963 start_codon:yes stop_codon:yes gene_type:complete